MGAEAHVNTCYKHFYYFIREFSLVDQRELEPLVRLSPHCPPLSGLASMGFQIQRLRALRKSNTQVDILGDHNSFNRGILYFNSKFIQVSVYRYRSAAWSWGVAVAGRGQAQAEELPGPEVWEGGCLVH